MARANGKPDYGEQNDYAYNDRVETHPATDAWMQGDCFGNVADDSKEGKMILVKLDSGRRLPFARRDLRPA